MTTDPGTSTDRALWIAEKRALHEERYDQIFAAIYDKHFGQIASTHRKFLARFLALLEPEGTVLDAACGTGKYWSAIETSGRAVWGIDQSQEMLRQAARKHPNVPIEKCGLQELSDVDEYEGIICVDSMEFVFPEDWPKVLENFHRAIKDNGYLYITVEAPDEIELKKAFDAATEMGLPVVEGEIAHEGGYHFAPKVAQVKTWLKACGFEMLGQAVGDGYHHFLVRKTDPELQIPPLPPSN